MVSIEELRSWLKVSEDATAYNDWKGLKRPVIGPAVDENNEHGEDGSFFVSYDGVREGKSYQKVRLPCSNPPNAIIAIHSCRARRGGAGFLPSRP